jgi:hypothetical protein
MPKDEEGDLMEMRCRACGIFLGYRRRTGNFVFWCSEPCSETPMPKFSRTQIRDEVALEMYLSGVGMMEIARYTQSPYTRVQQVLYRLGVTLSRPEQTEASA